MILGLIPDCDLGHVRSAGNAAGTGALIALLSGAARTEIEGVVRRVEKIETAVEPRFQEHFVEALAIPHRTARFEHLARVVDLPAAPNPRDSRRIGDPAATAAPAGRRRRREERAMTDDSPRRRSGGRAARQAARLHAHAERIPFLVRKLQPFEVLDEEGLSLIEHNADTILEEVGLVFRGDEAALELFRAAGADVQGERVRFPRGMCRSIVQASAPREFTQYARNHANDVRIGGPATVFAPNYGSPFVRDLDSGRRYGTIEDFRNFVKLAYLSPHLHHSGGTICEPVDVPVNKRHLDMVYAHMRYSDKAFMGSVTAPERARDTVDMARILFGADYLEDHAVVLSLINANSPLVWDATMLGAARAYAEANQATLMTPFILAGAMAPVTAAGVCAQTLAEALGGMAFVQLVRPGARSCSARSQARCRCSRAPRPSGRRSPHSSSTRWPRWPAGSASRSAPGAACAPRRSPTRRRPTSLRRRSSRRCSPGSTSSSMRPAGSRAGSRSATRSSSSTPTSAG